MALRLGRTLPSNTVRPLTVTVTVNGRTVFEGKIRPNINAMLASVATFYDPRRIFPAFIDIE